MKKVFKWKCDKGIVFVNGVLVREIFIREHSRTIWEKRKNKRVRGLRRAMEVYKDRSKNEGKAKLSEK